MWRLLAVVLYFVSVWAWGAEPELDFFGNTPIPETALVHTPEPKPDWQLYGAPAALLAFFFCFCFIVKLFL